MNVPVNTGDAKKWKREQCSYVVYSKCGAPVVSIDSTSDAAAATYKLYFMEYTDLGATGLTMVGATGELFFLPVASKASVAGKGTAAQKMPVDELAGVSMIAGTVYKRAIPGQTIVSWLKCIGDGYKTYDATVVTYDAARKEWNDGKRGAKPYQPVQPAAPDALTSQLKYSDAAQTVKATVETGGFGYITQYEIEWTTSLNKNAGHYFGTQQSVAAMESAAASSIDATKAHNYHWKTNTGKTAAGTGTAKCDTAYVQVTGHLLKTDAGTAQKLIVVVTEGTWASTLEEQIPKRPAASTAPNASGAAYLTVGALSSLVALSLF